MIGQPYSKYKIKYHAITNRYHVQRFWWTHRWVNVAAFDTRAQARNYIAEQKKVGNR